MKRLIILILLFSNCYLLKSQNLFKVGLKHFEKGEYKVADSLFSLYLKNSPKDINAHYNHGVTRLYLGDTCSFCDEMTILRVFFRDESVNDLYYKICSSIETHYYDKNYVNCERGEERFTEVIEKNRCCDYKTVTVHDKESMGKAVVFNPSNLNSDKSDINAIYRLYIDGHKIFTFTFTQPSYPGGDDAKSEFKDKSPLIQLTKQIFNLHEVTANVEYIIDKDGSIRDIELVDVNTKIAQMEDFKKYVNQIILSMPKQIPAKYRDENVDYLVRDFLSFW